jgi:serine/threonine protein kinase
VNTSKRCDVYALGMLLWELFTDEGPPPDKHKWGVHLALQHITSKAMERSPDARYQSVEELMAEFDIALVSLGAAEAVVSPA